MQNVAVIGAGITGITTAYSLIQAGAQVTIFDRNRYAAMETSYANGGQLSASNAEVWNSWSTLRKGVKWLFQKDAPLSLNLSPSVHKYRWLAEFVANIPNYERHTIATTRLAIEAREHLLGMAQSAGVEFDLERRGILHLYQSRESFEHATAVNKLLAKGGLDRRAVTTEEMHALEPALTTPFFGGYYTESDFTGDIHKFSRQLADACIARGALSHFGTSVEQLEWTPSGIVATFKNDKDDHATSEQFDAVVICAGVNSGRFAAMLNDRVNVYPVKGYSITVPLNDHVSRNAAPWVSLLDDDAKVVTSRLGESRFRVAGTAEFNGYNRDIRADRVRPLVEWTQQMFPSIDTSTTVPWAGLRPMMPSMMPRVGPGRHPGVFYNTGHGHLGWTLSAATAHAVTSHVRGGRRSLGAPVSALSPSVSSAL